MSSGRRAIAFGRTKGGRVKLSDCIGLVMGAVVVLYPATSLAISAKSCLVGRDPSVADDLQQLVAVRAQVEAQCPCGSFDGSVGKTHRRYLRCANRVIACAVGSTFLRKQCKAKARSEQWASTCGISASLGKAPCLVKDIHDRTKCAIIPSTRCIGTTCPAFAHCIDAADTNGDGLIGAGDSAQCAPDPLTPTPTSTATQTSVPIPTDTFVVRPHPTPPSMPIPFQQLQKSDAQCPAGQTNFYGNCVELLKVIGAAGTGEYSYDTETANTAYHVTGLAIDRSSKPNKIYVTDLSDNRVLAWSSLGSCSASPGQPCTNNTDCGSGDTCVIDPHKPADMVFGQADFQRSACNRDNNLGIFAAAGPDTLCFTTVPAVSNLAEDEQGINPTTDDAGNLYILDMGNHRVLKYVQPFNPLVAGGGDNVADAVWGQPDFFSNGANQGHGPTATSLSFRHWNFAGVQLSVDAQGNVWVPDNENGRVLRFPPNGQTADVVLGQADFNVSPPVCDPSNPAVLCSPVVAKVNPDTGEVYVFDEHLWDRTITHLAVFSPPFSSGMSASRVLNFPMPQFTRVATPPSYFEAYGIEFNRYKQGRFASGEFWMTTPFKQRALLFDAVGNVADFIGGPSVDTFASPPDQAWDPVCFAGVTSRYAQPNRYFVGSPAFDDANNLYFPLSRPSIVLRFPMPNQFRVLTNSAGNPVNCFPLTDGFMMHTDSWQDWNTVG